MKKLLLKANIVQQLTGAAITLICVSLFSFVNPSPTGDQPGGGKSIRLDEGKNLIRNFMLTRPGQTQKGGYLSKQALDVMFVTHPDANGIYWYIGSETKSSGETVLNLIVQPAQTPYTGINTDNGTEIFVSETMCPTVCGSLAD